jgi:23S rRNA pseudouridine2604 synthase
MNRKREYMAKNDFKKPELSNNSGEPLRLNKFLSEAGVCSRREADRLIEAGKIQIDGQIAQMGDKVLPHQKVSVNGKSIKKEEKQVLIAFNKPRGIVCTTEKKEPNNIIDYLNFGKRIYPIGRLDKESEGLILLTNNGDIVNKILRGSNNHEKEYIVKVNKPITRAFLKGMISGVPILDTVTKPCEITTLDKYTFKIIITQGLNRQIRRMCEYFDYKVLELKRIRIMNIKIGRLNEGGYRNITELEFEELLELISDSYNNPTDMEITTEGVIHDEYEQRVKIEKQKREEKRKEVIEKKAKEKLEGKTVRGNKEKQSYSTGAKRDYAGQKDNKGPKENKAYKGYAEQRDRKDHKEYAGQKDRNGYKEYAGQKDRNGYKEYAGQRDRKDYKDYVGQKDRNDRKDYRDQKDHRDDNKKVTYKGTNKNQGIRKETAHGRQAKTYTRKGR